MGLLWMVLLVVLVGAEAQNLTEVKGMLGKDVTLNCSIRNTDVHWYMEIHNQFKGFIGRTFATGETSYSSPDFESKYLMSDNRLVIKNMTSGDRRLYFCGRKTSGDVHFLDTFRLVSDQKNHTNQTNHENLGSLLKREEVVFISLSLNAILGLILVGLSCFLSLKRKNSKQLEENPETFNCENPEPAQYEEIRFPTSRVPAAAAAEVYYKVQLPHC
ncbi:uncharacterized protein LOC127532032 [Acanthochromis polyacanthus]|uniref:uncharacterized protein LOC127532032 n=1 Tax=Acanthochromis polyacanthus TaxID=80966 RepID=UPI0022349CC5|nr:uncharacterized protein LOC127532032 [Acanthochromis polyacanthus]